MMSATQWLGMPLLAVIPDVARRVVAEAGEDGEGWQMVLIDNHLVIHVAHEGEEFEARCGIEDLLEAVCLYTRAKGS
jgi:hypothetical protein